jgi:hypothetical protein
MPGIQPPGTLQHRIAAVPHDPVALLGMTPALLQSQRTVSQQLDREQKRHRRPPRHQHGFPGRRGRSRDVRGQEDHDAQQKCQPHHVPRPATTTCRLPQETNRRQLQQTVNRQRPQGGTRRIRTALQGKSTLMHV